MIPSLYMFLRAQKLTKKKGTKKSTFYILGRVYLLTDISYFEDWISDAQFETEYFCRLLDLKICIE